MSFAHFPVDTFILYLFLIGFLLRNSVLRTSPLLVICTADIFSQLVAFCLYSLYGVIWWKEVFEFFFCSKMYQYFSLCIFHVLLWGKGCSMTMTAACPTSWTRPRKKVAFSKAHLETNYNWRSFWHRSALLPCLLLCTRFWNRLLSWPGQACKVISHTW